ncbi:MAG: TlpA family protein disulfide reductase [Anaerolineae bacterium]|nr:TlpA family protein disulfide reductase [Anaerolineae bacterium]
MERIAWCGLPGRRDPGDAGLSRRSRGKPLPILGRLRFVVLLLLSLAACAQVPVSIETEEPFYAWDFTLQSRAGESYTLSALRGKWVIVNFWATWCGPCREEMPALQAIHDQYGDVMVLGVNQRETVEVIDDFLADTQITFPVLMNPDDAVLLDYNVVGLPQTLVVNPEGIIVWRQFGPVDLETFSAEIASLRNT